MPRLHFIEQIRSCLSDRAKLVNDQASHDQAEQLKQLYGEKPTSILQLCEGISELMARWQVVADKRISSEPVTEGAARPVGIFGKSSVGYAADEPATRYEFAAASPADETHPPINWNFKVTSRHFSLNAVFASLKVVGTGRPVGSSSQKKEAITIEKREQNLVITLEARGYDPGSIMRKVLQFTLEPYQLTSHEWVPTAVRGLTASANGNDRLVQRTYRQEQEDLSHIENVLQVLRNRLAASLK